VHLDFHEGSFDFFRNLQGTESETLQLQHFGLLIMKADERIGNPRVGGGYQRSVTQGLSDIHFDRVMQHLQATLEELDVSTHEITKMTEVLAAMRDRILNRKF
jgi:truncated hemoglobin YjbI